MGRQNTENIQLPNDFSLEEQQNKLKSKNEKDGENQLELLITPLLDDDFLEYSEFEQTLLSYQEQHPEINLKELIGELNQKQSKLGNTQLELAVEDFREELEKIKNIDAFVDILIDRNKTIEKIENKEEVTENKEEVTENKEEVTENKEEVTENKEDGIDGKKNKVENKNNLLSNYGIEDFENFRELKNDSIKQAKEFLKSSKCPEKYENTKAEDIYMKFLILSKKDELLESFKKSEDFSPEKYKQFEQDLENQARKIHEEDPKIFDFVNIPKGFDDDLYNTKIPTFDPIKASFVGANIGNKQIKKDGNILTIGDQKIILNEDGTFEKKLVGKNNFELGANMPKSFDISDYRVSYSKIKKQKEKIEKKGSEVEKELKEIDFEINELKDTKESSLGLQILELDSIDFEINELKERKEILLVEKQEIINQYNNINVKGAKLLKDLDTEKRRYQLEVLENDEKTREILEFLNKIGYDMIPKSFTDQLIQELKMNSFVIPGLNLNPTTIDLENGRFGESESEIGGDRWKNNLVKFVEKIIYGENNTEDSIFNGKEFKGELGSTINRTEFNYELEKTGIKKNTGWNIELMRENLKKGLDSKKK